MSAGDTSAIAIFRGLPATKDLASINQQSPGVLNGIKRGTALSTVIEPSMVFTRLCVDQAEQALEGTKDVDAAPMLSLIDNASIKSWDKSSALVPSSWKPIFRVD